MEQLKAYALRKHFFRILNDEGIENAYHFLIQHPPMVDNLSKVYQNSKDEAYILQLNRLNETELLQSQNEISMLLIHAPWNLSLWRLFANTFSDKKVSLKQEILWFIAIKQDNRHGYLQFVNVIRGARRWNLEAIYAQLKLIELSKFKQNHLQQVEFLAQKTYFELDELSRQGEKVRRITTLFSKLVKIPDYKVLLRETPYFCSFCYFHLGDIKKALAFITINFNTRDQVLMINQLLYYDYVNEGRDLLETLIKNDSVSSPPLIEFFRTQIKAATEGEAMVKPLMIWLKRYPKRVSITLIEESEDALQSHPNQPLVSLCLKHLCNVFIGDQAAQTLYMKSLEWLQDTSHGFEERVKRFNQALTVKQKVECGQELLLFCYEHDLKDKVMDVFDDYFNKQGEDADARIKNMLEGLKKLEENQSFDLKGVMKAVRQKDYPSLFLIIEMLDEHRGAQQLVEFLYLLDPAQFLVHFIAWWLTQPQEHDRTTLMPEKRHVLHQLKRCKIEASDIDTLKEESFLEEKLTLYLRQFITLETFCLFLELKSYLIPKEEIVKQLLICLAKQPTHASYSIRYALLKYLCDWCPTPKLFLTTARCCYRIKKYEDAAFYFKQCQCLSRQREDIQIEMYISTFLNGINDFKVLDEKHSPKMMRQVVLLLMSDRQFVKRRTEIYLYYLKNHCQLELLLWWYHLYRRLHQYDEALNVIDHLSQCDLTIYRDVLNHFKTKLEQRYQLNTQPLIEEVNQRLNLVENQVNPVKPSMLQPFKPDDIKLLKELMYKHDVIRQLPYHEIPFLELEWDVEYGKQKTGVLAWFKGVIEKFSLKSLFNKS